MLSLSKDDLTINSKIKNWVNSSNAKTKLTLFILTLFFMSFNAIGQSAKVAESKKLVKFCHSVNEINKGYDIALQSYSVFIEETFDKVISGDSDVTFPVDQVSFAFHYKDMAATIATLERTYANQAVGIEEQQLIVKKIKLLQREKNKLEMFTKAFADYVNTKRHLQDLEKNEAKLMNEKIIFSVDKMTELLSDERQSLAVILYEAESFTFDNHALKSLLIPMNEDIKFLSTFLQESENIEDKDNSIAAIKEKRASLADGEPKRLKEAEYLIKNSEHMDLYKNFYLRYQSILTKSQNVLSDQNVSEKIVKSEWLLNRVSLEQLRSTYQELKSNALADL